MSKDLEVDNDEETGVELDIQPIILEELCTIRGDLDCIKQRISKLEAIMREYMERTEQVIKDLNTIYAFQKTYTSRLSAIEEVCADVPLKSSTPLPKLIEDDKLES